MIKKLTYAVPFLVSIFCVVSLYAANAERIDPGQMIAPAIFGILVAGIFLLLFWLLKWTAEAAPWVATIFTAIFLLWHISPWPVSVIVLVGGLSLGVWAKSKTINGTGFIGLILTISILVSGVMGIISGAGKADNQVTSGPYVIKPGQANIYFIVPDRLPSPAAMRESGIDPDQAITDLRALGFYVKEDQVSADPYVAGMGNSFYVETTEVPIKTTRTMRYFASVLNGGADIALNISYQDCRTMIQDNAAFTWLHGKGYTIVNVPSWFSETARFTDEDIAYPFEDVNLYERVFRDELGEAYFERTILAGLNFRVLESFGSQVKVEKARLQWQRDKITEIAGAGPDSRFVFAHLTLPHEPFIFGDPDDSIPDQYYANIRAALTYLDELAGEIRAKDPTAIVIIQSDEGMAYRKPADLNFFLSPVQWSGVFTAWYLPVTERWADGNYWYLSRSDLMNTEYLNLEYIKFTDILDVVINSK